MNETEWDALCARARTLPATIADELAARNERISDLKAALDDVLGEVAWLSKRVAELETALAPFARLEAPQGWDDDMWMHQYVRTGDVRMARQVMGGDGK